MIEASQIYNSVSLVLRYRLRASSESDRWYIASENAERLLAVREEQKRQSAGALLGGFLGRALGMYRKMIRPALLWTCSNGFSVGYYRVTFVRRSV